MLKKQKKIKWNSKQVKQDVLTAYCQGHAGEHLFERFTYQTRQRAESGGRNHGRSRDGRYRGRNRLGGYARSPGRQSHGQRGDLLR